MGSVFFRQVFVGHPIEDTLPCVGYGRARRRYRAEDARSLVEGLLRLLSVLLVKKYLDRDEDRVIR
jgi:hypothetical protein